MRVIDLFNNIANGEDVPKKIRYKGFELKRTQSEEVKRLYVDEQGCFFPAQYGFDLNDKIEIIEENKKIEIIEENKKIEKIKNMNCDIICSSCADGAVMVHDLSNLEIVLDLKTLRNKLNDVIKKVNVLEDK